jgi:hypothetical protein
VRLNKVIRPLVLCVVGCGIVVTLFHTSGPVYHYFPLDLSFLLLPFIGCFWLRLGAKLATIFLSGLRARLTSILLTSAAWAFLWFLLLHGLDTFYRSLVDGMPRLAPMFPRITQAPGTLAPILNELRGLEGYAVLIVAGVTICRLASIPAPGERWWAARPGGGAFSILVIGFSVWSIFMALAVLWGPLSGVGSVAFAGLGAVALAMLGAYGEGSSNPFLADLCRWAGRSQLGNFTMGFLLGGYIVFLRPVIMSVFPYGPVFEWALVCLVVWRIWSGVHYKLDHVYSAPLQISPWRRHVQRVERKVDEEFLNLSVMQRQFVEDGVKGPLLVHLTLLLGQNGIPRSQICYRLGPLIDCEAEPVPWFAFGWEQQRVMRRNQEKRRRILNQIMGSVGEIGARLTPVAEGKV